jgi:hypothetical protein
MRLGGAVLTGLAGAILLTCRRLTLGRRAGRSQTIGQVRVWTINYRAHTGASVRPTSPPCPVDRATTPPSRCHLAARARPGRAGKPSSLRGSSARGSFAAVSPDGTDAVSPVLGLTSWKISPDARDPPARCPGSRSTAQVLARRHGRAGGAPPPRPSPPPLAGVAASTRTPTALQYHSFPRSRAARVAEDLTAPSDEAQALARRGGPRRRGGMRT